MFSKFTSLSTHEFKLIHSVNRAVYLFAAVWVFLIFSSVYFNIRTHYKVAENLGKNTANASFNKDLSIRVWAASHGGLYAPVTERTQPNPYLSHIFERDITTPSGRKLTLMNPAFIIRQLTKDTPSLFGVKGNITSLNPLNKDSKPDPWEEESLKKFEQGIEEVVEQKTIKGVPYMRLMRPMITKESCLKCHIQQGDKVGNIRGGISVSVDMTPYFLERDQAIKTTLLTHFFVLFSGLILLLFYLKAKRESLLSLLTQLQQEKQLEDSEARFVTLANLSPVGIFQTDPKGHCTYVNQKWCDISGLDFDSAMGTGWVTAVHLEDRSSVFAEWEKSIRENRTFLLEYRFHNTHGETTWVLGEAMAIRDQGDHQVKGFVGAITDISDSKIREKELARAKTEAELANRAKSRFLGLMSHELRTPMNGVLGMTQLLQLTKLNPEQKGYCKIIMSSGQALTDILSDILDLIKIQSGRQTLATQVFSIHHVVEEALNLYAGIAKTKNIQLRLKISPKIASQFQGDSSLLTKIMVNLIGNGVKFTDQGQVSVTLELISELDSTQTIECKVKDTGIGIEQSLQKIIFEPFQQGDDSSERKYGGTGLGLSIVKESVKLLQGSIELTSELGKGSCFYLKVPLQVSHQGPPVAIQNDSRMNPKKNVSVLLAEDDPINQAVITKMLSTLGLEVDIASNGEVATKLAAKKEYSFIFMDLLMPLLTGDAATSIIRKSKGPNQATPIIALTAMASDLDKENCFNVGMDEFITKPISLVALQGVIEKYQNINPKIN